jgi:16S rRNA (uracil1498-N3)-methyltransferase
MRPAAAHHLRRVLRLRDGAPVSYTDGAGRQGEGRLDADGVLRGPEVEVASLPDLTIAVAPPKATSRARFIVEKLTELGVSRLVWLDTKRGEGRPPRPGKAIEWAIGALEQSRGAHLMEIDGPQPVAGPWSAQVVVADQAGEPFARVVAAHAVPDVVLVGPEGGFDDGELPVAAARAALAVTTLRTETAAVVAATLCRAHQPPSA